MRLGLALLLTLPFAGCLSPTSLLEETCAAPELATLTGPREEGAIARAPGEPAPLLYWARNPTAGNATVVATTLPAPEGALDPSDPERAADASGLAHALAPGGLAFGSFHADATNPAGLVFQAELFGEGCDRSGLAVLEAPLAPETERDVGAIGKGALVRTGGFWTNGTSFYTNHAGVDGTEGIPKGYLGEYTGDEPLKVYIYAEGDTVPPKRYQDAGYAMTIRGFNAALDGFPAGTARLAYLTPEDAYTAEGREDHPLYGDALLFWIEVDEIVDLPCPLPQPQCDLPGVPRLPIPPVPPLAE